MIKKMILATAIFAVAFQDSYAQYANDVLRFSQTTFSGTARIQGMGGSQTALGGDISSISGNPAGLGFYRQSDFSISPQLSFATTSTDFLSDKFENSKDNFNISNLGVVFGRALTDNTGGARSDGWSSIAFGIGLNRTNNFHNTISYSGINNKNSLGDFFAEQLNAIGFDSLSYAETGFTGYLVDQYTDGKYFSLINGRKVQTNTQKLKGSQSDWSFSLGSNYKNKLYVGASINLTDITSRSAVNYSESGYIDTLRKTNRFNYTERTTIQGSGFNAKAGVIYRPVDLLRFGATIQTPTYYQMDDAFSSEIVTTFNDNNTATSSFNSVSEYNLVTPFRYSFGVALFFQKYGFITADYEGLDYGNGKYRSDFDASGESFENDLISNSFTKTSNLRFGGELKLSPITIRGGYAIYGDPFTNTTNLDRQVKSITGGLGYASEDFYIDAALINSKFNSTSTPYSLNNRSEPVAATINKRNSFMLTIGTKF